MIIDPVKPTPEQLPILVAILEDLKANRISGIDISPFCVFNPEESSASLQHRILMRPNKKSDDVRFDVVDSTCLDAGSCGQIFSILATLKLAGETVQNKIKPISKQRIVKMQPLEKDGAQPIFSLEEEYSAAALTTHLHPKKPISFGGYSWMVMRKIEGENFFDAIFEDTEKIRVFSLQQRFTMTIELLLTVKEQVATLGLIHRDLKPENIIFDRKSGKFGIIDYGFAKLEKETSEFKNCGTLSYLTPEAFQSNPSITQASDVYSLGRVLGLIWHNHQWPGYHSSSLKEMLSYVKINDYSKLFTDISGLDSSAADTIRSALQSMTAYQPQKRISLQKAITQFCDAFETQFASLTLVYERIENHQTNRLARPVICEPFNFSKASDLC